jgi:hypothetical protein
MPNSVFCQVVAIGPSADLTRLWNAAARPARAVPALAPLLAAASRPLPADCTPLDVMMQVHAEDLLQRERRFFDFVGLAPRYRFPGGRGYRGSRVADIVSRLGSRTSLAIEFHVDRQMPPGFWSAFARAWPDIGFAASWVCESGSFVGYAVRLEGAAQEFEIPDARRFAAARRARDRVFAPLLEALREGRPYRFLAGDRTPTSRRLALAAGIDMANVIHVASRADLAAVKQNLAGEVLPPLPLPKPKPSARRTP